MSSQEINNFPASLAHVIALWPKYSQQIKQLETRVDSLMQENAKLKVDHER